MLKELLLIDIETVPQTDDYFSLNTAWQSLWKEKISKTVPETVPPEESWRKAGILAEFGKIVCISTGYFFKSEDNIWNLKLKSISGDNEIELLNSFISLCDKMYAYNKNFRFAGHNIKEFDIPYICRRMLINHLPLPNYLQLHDKKPWEVNMYDTLSRWKFGDVKNYISLNLLANVLGLETSKTDIDGSMVQDVYYKEKNLPRIVEYCQRDVVVTANIILRFENMPILSVEHITIAE